MVEVLGLSQVGTPQREPDARSSLLELALAALVALTVLTVAAGSAWRPSVKADASNLRWLCLFALALTALALARRSARGAPPRRSERRGALLVAVLIALSFVSAAWSVDPRLTLERAVTVAAVLVAASAVAFSAARRPELPRLVAIAIVVAIGLLLLASLALALVRPSQSIQVNPARFRGVEENPDTLPLLAAFGLPLGAWLAVESKRSWERIALSIELLSILVLMGATGSRGGLVAGVAGLLVVVVAATPGIARVVVVAAAVVVVFGASAKITPLTSHLAPAQPASAPAPPSGAGGKGGRGSSSKSKASSFSAIDPLSLDSEVGRPRTASGGPPTRDVLTSSGRVQAWIGALHQADERPLLGYGFGTEDHVFIDRYYVFEGSRPENSWIGLYLQLGAVGVLAFAALVLWVAIRGVRALRRLPRSRRLPAAALAGVFAGGCVEMIVQSYALSAGDIAMLSFWLCAGMLAGALRWSAS